MSCRAHRARLSPTLQHEEVSAMRGSLFASFGAAGVLLIACALVTPALLPAQTSTGTVRGVVMGETGEPLAGASVTARNPQTNFQRGMLTEEGGFYNLG